MEIEEQPRLGVTNPTNYRLYNNETSTNAVYYRSGTGIGTRQMVSFHSPADINFLHEMTSL